MSLLKKALDRINAEIAKHESQELCRLCNAPATRSYSIVQHGKDLVTALCERCFSKI